MYYADPDKKRGAVKRLYYADPVKKRGAVKRLYYADPDKKRGAVKVAYYANPEKKKSAFRKSYCANTARMKRKYGVYYAQNHKARLLYFQQYHVKKVRQVRYTLEKPKPIKIESYLRKIQANLLSNSEAKSQLIKAFHVRGVAQNVSFDMEKTVCKLAARKLVNMALQKRSDGAGTLLASVRCIVSLTLKERGDFGEGSHNRSTEPYFYEAAYQPVKRDAPIPVNKQGQCIVTEKIKEKCAKWNEWKCSSECKPLSEGEVNSILSFKEAFKLPIEEVRAALSTCDYGCPFGHYSKQIGETSVGLKGHPIVCYCGSECTSQLRILRAASTHFSVLRKFLRDVHCAISSHKCVLQVDEALNTGNYDILMKMLNIKKFESLFSSDIYSKYEQVTGNGCSDSCLRRPDLETHLVKTYIKVISELEKEIYDFPECVCCCCERLSQRKSVSVVRLSDEFHGEVWPDLKCHILKSNPDAGNQVLYMCNHCKPMVRRGIMPPRCVLNGLQTVPIPKELAVLDPLSRQLLQRAKCYQTIVRLGTYMGNVPVYNSLKACKGTMFFLPLPLNKTLKRGG